MPYQILHLGNDIHMYTMAYNITRITLHRLFNSPVTTINRINLRKVPNANCRERPASARLSGAYLTIPAGNGSANKETVGCRKKSRSLS
jgi:hypothetical protein